MNYSDLARGIYTPYFSGEDIQGGNYPTPMFANKQNQEEDIYTNLASRIYGPALSGEDIQSMYGVPQQQTIPSEVTPATSSTPTGYSGAPLGTGGGGEGFFSNPFGKMLTNKVSDIGSGVFKSLFGNASNMFNYGSTLNQIENLGGDALAAGYGLEGDVVPATGATGAGVAPLGMMFAGESKGPIQSALGGLSGIGSLGSLAGTVFPSLASPILSGLAGLGVPLWILGGFIEGLTQIGKKPERLPIQTQGAITELGATGIQRGADLATQLGIKPPPPIDRFGGLDLGVNPQTGVPWGQGNYHYDFDPSESYKMTPEDWAKGVAGIPIQDYGKMVPIGGWQGEDERRMLEAMAGSGYEPYYSTYYGETPYTFGDYSSPGLTVQQGGLMGFRTPAEATMSSMLWGNYDPTSMLPGWGGGVWQG